MAFNAFRSLRRFRTSPSARSAIAVCTAGASVASVAELSRVVSCSEPEPEPASSSIASRPSSAPLNGPGAVIGAPLSGRHYDELIAAVLRSPDGQAIIRQAALLAVRDDSGREVAVEAASDIRRTRSVLAADLQRAGDAAISESSLSAARIAAAHLQGEAETLASREAAKAVGRELPSVVQEDPLFRRLLEEHRTRMLDELHAAVAEELREMRGESVKEAYFKALESRILERVHVAESGCTTSASSAHVASYWTTALGVAGLVAAGLTILEAKSMS